MLLSFFFSWLWHGYRGKLYDMDRNNAIIDIVYPYKHSVAEGEELRYSLRSVAKNFRESVRIWIMGQSEDDRLEWLKESDDCRFILIPSVRRKEQNIIEKLKWCCRNIAGRFILFMDDIYCTSEVSISDFEYRYYLTEYNSSPTDLDKTKWQRLKRDAINEMLDSTIQYPVYDFGCHCPYLINSREALSFLENTEFHTKFQMYYQNSSFLNGALPISELNMFRLEQTMGMITADEMVKFKLLNHEDKTYERVEPILSELFPCPCRFEK